MIAADDDGSDVDETNREVERPRAAHGRLGKDGQRRQLPAASPDPSLPGRPPPAPLHAAAVCVLRVWPEAEVEEGQGAPGAERPPHVCAQALGPVDRPGTLRADPGVEPPVLARDRGVDGGPAKRPAAGLPKNVERIGLKPFHVAVLAGHMEVVRAFIEHRPRGNYREFLVETTKNASTPFTAIELAALAGRPDVYRFLAGLQNGLGGMCVGRSGLCMNAVHESRCSIDGHPTHAVDLRTGGVRSASDTRTPVTKPRSRALRRSSSTRASPSTTRRARVRVAHYAQILAYFGMKPPVPEPPPVDMRRRNMLRVLEAVSDEATPPA